jgi:hypothetical protein
MINLLSFSIGFVTLTTQIDIAVARVQVYGSRPSFVLKASSGFAQGFLKRPLRP